jgi:hypothetical protein
MTYSINISNNEGLLYHILIDSELILSGYPEELEFVREIDYKKVESIISKCGFSDLFDIYYEVVPSDKITILNYIYDPSVVGNLRAL